MRRVIDLVVLCLCYVREMLSEAFYSDRKGNEYSSTKNLPIATETNVREMT
jgi:hypothetical protein